MEIHLISWIGRLTIVQMATLIELIYRFNTNKIPAGFFVGIGKQIPKVILKYKGPRRVKTILKL